MQGRKFPPSFLHWLGILYFCPKNEILPKPFSEASSKVAIKIFLLFINNDIVLLFGLLAKTYE